MSTVIVLGTKVMIQRFTIDKVDEYCVSVAINGELQEKHTFPIPTSEEHDRVANEALGKCSELCQKYGEDHYHDYGRFIWKYNTTPQWEPKQPCSRT